MMEKEFKPAWATAPQSIAEDIENRFKYHPPIKDQAKRYEAIRGKYLELAKFIVSITPPGREQATSLTQLEFSMMMACASIARNEK